MRRTAGIRTNKVTGSLFGWISCFGCVWDTVISSERMRWNLRGDAPIGSAGFAGKCRAAFVGYFATRKVSAGSVRDPGIVPSSRLP